MRKAAITRPQAQNPAPSVFDHASRLEHHLLHVDNIDVKAATQRGIVVMNAPDGNTITTAEHTIALLVSMARNVPQAHAKLQNGEWDKKSFVGVELNGKTLGVIGLGRIGKHVASIARGFGMQIVAFDPFTSAENAKELVIESATLD